MWGARAAVDVMRRQGKGHIITAPGLAVYGASKHAVLGYSISLAGDLKHAGIPIHVSAICPDAIDTDMTRTVKGDRDAALLFSASKLLRAEDVAAEVMALVDSPRLVVIRPRVRGALAHIFRPFPGVGLRMLEQFRKLGERHQRRDAP
jgi:short-subunit dehydrogenase